ncbi:MAG: 1,4-dihydroxy-2-naphthoate octaprenyltransferase [Parachlamydia sp.]|jgi:1,4-dihydroxy-2-naphthoate octaprenyltransferase|nr:1,4-dihydroxy-2-naphthoate octaprenyltransferase [Parachlamydia sp.]
MIKQDVMQIKPWLLAARPKTLPICLAPILLGTMLSLREGGSIDWVLSVLAFLSLLFLQSGTNLVNDALDFQKGADTSKRLGPQRMTQAGLLTFEQVLRGGLFCFALAILLGIPLIMAGGWPFSIIIFLAVACGYFYTGGPYPLAYYGLGEPFIFLFYGLIGVPAIFYLQTGTLNPYIFVAAMQMGFLAMVPNAINNLRDIKSDAAANKNTLAVTFGMHFSKWEITLFSYAPYLIGLLWIPLSAPMMAFLPFLTILKTKKNIQLIWSNRPDASYQECFSQCLLILFLFTLLLIAGILV